jgi:hypothetical protein
MKCVGVSDYYICYHCPVCHANETIKKDDHPNEGGFYLDFGSVEVDSTEG